jgi:shikimate dehydrogenase
MKASGPGERFVLIGHPVLQSLSPAIHQAAYDQLGLPAHRYVAVDCADPEAVREQIALLRSGDLAGANVTVPWKRLALELADEVDAGALSTGAANVLCPSGSNGTCRIVAHNTDVPALAEELARGRPGARSAVVIGNGGAALAAVVACRSLGIGSVAVAARSFRGAAADAWPLARELRARGATLVAWPQGTGDTEFRRAVTGCDIVVQSTSDGMRGATDGTTVRDVVPWEAMSAGALAYDVVYNPAVTPFVAAALGAGLRAESGLGMLVGQAVLALELWLGVRPEAAPLRAAAERALAEKMRR